MSLLRTIRRYLPTAREIQQYRYLHLFGDSLKHPELWHFTRHSTATGLAIGLFCAFLPMPFEMLPAIFLASLMRGNLPLAVAGVWISNPVTWIPLYTPCYLLGANILNVEPVALEKITIFQLGWHYVALWLGCLIVGICLAVSSHFIVSYVWRSRIRQRWRHRRMQRQARLSNNTVSIQATSADTSKSKQPEHHAK